MTSLTREAAELQLASYPIGTFLVRGVGGVEGLVLSVVASDRCLHFQVAEINGHFRITSGHASPFFPSLDALLAYYRHSKTLGEAHLGTQLGAPPLSSSTALHQLPTTPSRYPTPTAAYQQQQQQVQQQHPHPPMHSPSRQPPSPPHLLQQSPLDQSPNRSTVKLGANGSSITFCFLDEKIQRTSKLYDLINLGNDVLEAETNGTLLEGELDRLRRVYKQQRAEFSEGCDRNAWVPNEAAKLCMARDCDRKFTKTTRKHHCRSCGKVVCKSCSSQGFYRAGLQLTKVCHTCFAFLSEVADGNVKQATESFASSLGTPAPVGT
jgi:hypothetical protein